MPSTDETSSNGTSPTLLVGVHSGAAIWEKFSSSYKVKVTTQHSNPTTRYLPKWNENHIHTESSVSIFILVLFIITESWRMDKQTGILLSNEKEKIIDSSNNRDESQMHYTKWKKPDSEGYIVWIYSQNIPEKTNV